MRKLLAVVITPLILLMAGGNVQGSESLAPLAKEVVSLVRQKALHQPRVSFTPASGDVEKALKAYVQSIDSYSVYLTPREKETFLAPGHQYFGVGMDLLQDNTGKLRCVPYAGTPAAKAGIVQGDFLESVDSLLVDGVPLPLLEGKIRGVAGSSVRLGIVTTDGRHVELSIPRVSITQPSVELLYDEAHGENIPRLKIYRFGARTKHELSLCLEAVPEGEPLILDLRGNVGGSLEAARQSAELFLEPDSVLYSLKNNTGAITTHTVSRTSDRRHHTIVIWQDAFTASAAEIFCAALRYNGKAVVLGQKSFGKGLVQTVFPCAHGGLLIMTTDELLLPNGATYNGFGIEPDLLVNMTDGGLGAFFRRSGEVLHSEEIFDGLLKDTRYE